MANNKSKNVLLREIVSRLNIVSGPGKKGEYIAWCPFHPDGKGKPPHQANLHVSDKGFICFACNEKGGLRKLADHLGINESTDDLSISYDYVDENGTLLYQAVRLNGKRFRLRRPNGNSGWIWNLSGTRRVLYRLPHLIESPQKRVFIVEGEKDANRLNDYRLLATTNSGGAGKWREEYSIALKDRDIVIIPDNDVPGQKHATQVANSLLGKAKSVKIVRLPELKDKGDVSDWLTEGHTKEELLEVCENATVIKGPVKDQNISSINFSSDKEDFHPTDLGNAKRLVSKYGNMIRYCHPRKKWLVWDGTRWQFDQTAEIMRLAKETVKSIYSEVSEIDDSESRKKAGGHAKSSESNHRLNSMISLAESEEGIPILPDQLDRDLWLLNCLNGTIDLKTGKLREHRTEDMITKIIPIEYDENAQCPLWESFLNQILGSNKELIESVQRAIGYSLTGETSEQCIFVLYGTGANGKTTFIKSIMAMLSDYAVSTPTETLMRKLDRGISNDIARLDGPRMVAGVETEEGSRFAEVLIKQITGGDTLTARFLHQEFFDFTPKFKLWVATNHKPLIRGTDHAIWRRIHLIPFAVIIPKEKQDRNLADRLIAELPGILRWSVEGCLYWKQIGLKMPNEVYQATANYRKEMDVLGAFISECCIESPGFSAQATSLYQAYTAWAQRSGERTITQTEFGRSLSERSFKKEKESKGKRLTYYAGLGLIDDNHNDEN